MEISRCRRSSLSASLLRSGQPLGFEGGFPASLFSLLLLLCPPDPPPPILTPLDDFGIRLQTGLKERCHKTLTRQPDLSPSPFSVVRGNTPVPTTTRRDSASTNGACVTAPSPGASTDAAVVVGFGNRKERGVSAPSAVKMVARHPTVVWIASTHRDLLPMFSRHQLGRRRLFLDVQLSSWPCSLKRALVSTNK